jgi:hypothetical protein
MKTIIFSIAIIIAGIPARSQDKFFTKSGRIFFDATSSSSPEKITGINKSTVCVIDTKTGAVQFSVLMKGFEFERALMQEHFNENYIESDKFPKSDFKGQIQNQATVDYTKDGTYNVQVKGRLTIHGISKDIETAGKIVVTGGKIALSALFTVFISEYDISIPSLVSDKISKTAKIQVDCTLEPFRG